MNFAEQYDARYAVVVSVKIGDLDQAAESLEFSVIMFFNSAQAKVAAIRALHDAQVTLDAYQTEYCWQWSGVCVEPMDSKIRYLILSYGF